MTETPNLRARDDGGVSDNLSLAQYAADPRAYEAEYNRRHRVEQRAGSETQQRHVHKDAWKGQDSYRKASPTPGVASTRADDAKRNAR